MWYTDFAILLITLQDVKKKSRRKMVSKIFCLMLSELPWSHLMWGLACSTVHHILKFVMDWMYVLPSESHVEALTSLSPKYGGAWSKEVIKFKCDHKEWSLDPVELVSYKKRHQRASPNSHLLSQLPMHQGKATWRQSATGSCLQVGKRASLRN